MNFKIGQKVVCINARYKTYCACPLVKGNIYTVYGFYTCECGSEQIYVDEVTEIVLMGCRCHRTGMRRHSYYSDRFRPLQYYDIYNKLFEKNKEVGGKSDIPKPIPKKIKQPETI